MKIISHNLTNIYNFDNNNVRDIFNENADIYCFQQINSKNLDDVQNILLPYIKNYKLVHNIQNHDSLGQGGVIILIHKDFYNKHYISTDIPQFEELYYEYINSKILSVIFDDFILVNIDGIFKLAEFKQIFYEYLLVYLAYLQQMSKKENLIVCGDFDLSNTEYDIDLNNRVIPKNYTKNDEISINKLHKILYKLKLVDIFRTVKGTSKEFISKNEIIPIKSSYFFISENLLKNQIFQSTSISHKYYYNNKFISLNLNL